ncbi:hypothetical protein [Aminobacter sp. BE322]|uniref:hypothetical protein n=1 Tax=unclassified Aminobacter TaxID=2644704 RepID=UPI003D236D9E
MKLSTGVKRIFRKARHIRPFGGIYFSDLNKRISGSQFIFIHSITNNIGDLMSCPIKYFKMFDVKNSFELSSKELLETIGFYGVDAVLNCLDGKFVVFGGGGLIGLDRHNVHERVIDFLSLFADRGGDVVVWGAGHNRIDGFREWLSGSGANPYPSAFERFRLVGLRDYPNPYDWVPCVSCMHPVFDEKFTSRYKCVAFLHGHESDHFGEEFSNIPNMFNIKKGNRGRSEVSFLESINFIGSGETVVTNSYHGLYWATLLGKEVIAIQNSSKFLNFKYTYSNCENFRAWKDYLGSGCTHEDALDECRRANVAFQKKFEILVER